MKYIILDSNICYLPEGVTRVVRAGLMAVLSPRKTEEGSHPPATVTFVTTRPNFSTQRLPPPRRYTENRFNDINLVSWIFVC